MNTKNIITYMLIIVLMIVFMGLYLARIASKEIEECVIEPIQEPNELDLYLISSIITSECNNCTTKTKYLVGQTVLNRARLSNKSIADVIFKKDQYYYACNFYPAHTEIAYKLLTKSTPVKYIDTLVTHFYTTSAAHQNWMLKMEVRHFIDNVIIGYIYDAERN